MDDDIEKYVLEQAKIEVEHTRSWPTHILAFFVAINVGVVTALFSLAARTSQPLYIPWCAKILLIIAILILLVWVLMLLTKNHRSYLQYRKIQIQYQLTNSEKIKAKYSVPPEWFIPVEPTLDTRSLGWTFYACIVFFVTILGVAGIIVS